MQLRDYILRRLLVLPILVIGVSIVVFTLTRVGGSPIGIYLSHEMSPEEVLEIEERFGLDKPVWIQYVQWVKGIVSGDFGWSGVAAAPVADVAHHVGRGGARGNVQTIGDRTDAARAASPMTF